MNIFTQLKTSKNLTNNEKQIVNFILDNPNAFLDMSSDQICKECFVSITTLYRLCQKLNISGLSDLKVKMSGYTQRLVASCSDETHLAIVISFGGRGLLANKITKILKENSTPILLISSTEDNPIKECVDYQLYLCSSENHYNKISSFSTRLSLLYILDILFACYFKTDYNNNLKKKLFYYKKISEV